MSIVSDSHLRYRTDDVDKRVSRSSIASGQEFFKPDTVHGTIQVRRAKLIPPPAIYENEIRVQIVLSEHKRITDALVHVTLEYHQTSFKLEEEFVELTELISEVPSLPLRISPLYSTKAASAEDFWVVVAPKPPRLWKWPRCSAQSRQ